MPPETPARCTFDDKGWRRRSSWGTTWGKKRAMKEVAGMFILLQKISPTMMESFRRVGVVAGALRLESQL
jgi:hypothetical protein